MSWLVQRDVDEGRQILNFTEWDRPQRELVEGARQSLLGRRMQSGGASARPLEQPATLAARCLDQRLGVALGRSDGVRCVAFGRENPLDRPCNGCIG